MLSPVLHLQYISRYVTNNMSLIDTTYNLLFDINIPMSWILCITIDKNIEDCTNVMFVSYYAKCTVKNILQRFLNI